MRTGSTDAWLETNLSLPTRPCMRLAGLKSWTKIERNRAAFC